MKILGYSFFEPRFLRYANRSPRWPKVRAAHLIENPSCAACGKSDRLDIHHIEPVHIRPERELDPDNLITLCSNNCHIIFGHLMNYKSWNKDVVSDCAVYLNKVKVRPYKI